MSTRDMNDKNAELVSGLMDGELDERSTDDVIAYLESSPEARQRWSRYHLISDVMKGHSQSRVENGFAEKVSATILDEPAILAPRRKMVPAFIKQVSGFAVAATVAVVAVLTVQTDNGVENDVQQVASTTPPSNAEWIRVNSGINWDVEQPSVESKLNAYLVNHNGYTSGVRGILPYAPIVSYDRANEVTAETVAPIEYQENIKK